MKRTSNRLHKKCVYEDSYEDSLISGNIQKIGPANSDSNCQAYSFLCLRVFRMEYDYNYGCNYN